MMNRLHRAAVAAAASALAVGWLITAGPAAAEPRRYVIDQSHMSLAFLVKHVGFAKTLGIFREAEGGFIFDESAPQVTDIVVTIDAASVFTNHEKRDQHLRAADFFDVANHPKITFKGQSAQATGPRTGTVTGDLTIRGVTRPVTLDVLWNKSGAYPFGDLHHAVGISARTKIKRSDFGMTYALQGELVGDEVEIIIEFEAIRQES